MSKKTSILNSSTIPPEILAAIAAGDAALAAGPRTGEAMKNTAAQIVESRAELLAAQTVLDDADVFATTCNEADLPQANKAVIEAAKCHDEKLLAVNRAERRATLLKEKAKTIDFEVAQASVVFESEVSLVASVARDEIAAELGESLTLFIAALSRAYAVQCVLPNRDLMLMLAEIVIGNPAGWQTPFIQGSAVAIGEKSVNLATIWRDNPDALKIFENYKVISDARQRLGRHTQFRETQPASGRGYTIDGNRGSIKSSVRAPAAASKSLESNMGKVLTDAQWGGGKDINQEQG
jgi:hypothetical protein